MTPTIALTKIETTDPRRLLPILNTDLDLIDAAIGSISGGGMSNPMTAPADLIVGGAAGAPTRLGVGGAGQVLTVVGGVLAWATPAAAGMSNPMTTPGDVIVGGAAGAPGRLGVGAADQVLRVVAGAPAWSAPAATANLLTNPGFEVWQRGAGPIVGNLTYAADRWRILLGGSDTMSVTRDTANADGAGYCAALAVTVAAGSGFHQYVESYAQLAGKTVTFAARVKCATASAARLEIGDGVSVSVGAFHTGDGTYQTLTVTRTLSAAATELRVGVLVRAVGTYAVYVDAAVLVTGSAAPAYAPLHPAEALVRCQRYYQEIGGLDPNEYAAAGQCTATTTAIVVVRYPVEMAVAPTATVSAPGDWSVTSAVGGVTACTSVAASMTTARDTRLVVGVASGLVAGDATLMRAANLAARIRFESNPA